jgi:predicted ATPase/DNA-binding CsgD family transcriptional regulator
MAKPVLSGQVTGRRRLDLPAEAARFVGRGDDVSAITALLASARLVTVVGPAGVGKTRVCLRAAAPFVGRLPDGVVLVELSELRDPALLVNAVAAALGLPDTGAGAAVRQHLRTRRLLLILDTCEHLVDACAAFAETVLRDAPEVTLLATSRQPLDAPGEHVFRLRPLGTSGDAVELFALRAAAAVPDFEVTPDNRADVVRLCRRLDGVPLAIELAAVLLRALPLPDLADRLKAGFGVLAASRRGATERHQTLRTAVQWSYDLCTPAERSLWGRLAVFGGPFDVAAVEEVCADADHRREEVIDALIGLVDKSVVLRADSDEDRYRLPDAMREFGAEKFAAEPETGSGGDPVRVRDRLAARYLSMATRFDQNFLDDDQADRYRELRREHASIVAALEHTLGDERLPGTVGELFGRARRGAALTIRLQGYWQMSGLLGEGRYWLGKVLRLFPPLSLERAWALGIDGRLATFQGDLAGALAGIRESIRLASDLGEPLAEALGYCYLNLALAFAGSHAEALAAGETARRTMTACDHRLGLIALEAQLGHLHQLAGEAGLAIECCQRGLAMLGPSRGERWITSYLHLVSGFALFQYPDRSAECAAATRRALAATHEIGDVVGIAYALEVLGWLAARDERFDEATLLLGAAEPLWRQTAGRLSNVALMEETHQRVVRQAREALGDRRYEAARARGAGLPREDVVRRAGSRAAAAVPAAAAKLTRREQEIAALVANGLSNRQIAARLFISKRTVDAHVEHIFGKLEISSRVQLTVWLQPAGG